MKQLLAILSIIKNDLLNSKQRKEHFLKEAEKHDVIINYMEAYIEILNKKILEFDEEKNLLNK